MKETIDAIYENGVLRPLRKLSMSEGQRLRLTVEPTKAEPVDEAERGTRRYVLAGLAGCLSSHPRFADDPVGVQRELRDEWS